MDHVPAIRLGRYETASQLRAGDYLLGLLHRVFYHRMRAGTKFPALLPQLGSNLDAANLIELLRA